LGPGYLYTRRRERLAPTYSQSAFRETVTTVIASVTLVGSSLTVFGVARIVFPSATPDVGELLRNTTAYVKLEYDFIGYYSIALYAFALVLAFIASHPKVLDSPGLKAKWITTLVGAPLLSKESGWSKLFAAEPDDYKRVACRLSDGAWIDGWLQNWNVKPEETNERSLTLVAPIRFRGPEQRLPQLLPVQYSVVSASDISRVDVTYVRESELIAYNESYQNPSPGEGAS
jgi:hypothetical protein